MKIKEKTLNILNDFLLYDDELHMTYHDLTRFSNTHNGLSKKSKTYDLKKDVNEDLKKNNELPENAKYKGIVKQKLF